MRPSRRQRAAGGTVRTGRSASRRGRIHIQVSLDRRGEMGGVRGGAYDDLGDCVRLDLRHHYASEICAHRWLEVCADPAYGHKALISRVRRAIPGALAAIRTDRGEAGPVALVSLGSGDGALDEAILRAIDKTGQLHSYCPVDSSFELLRCALRRIVNAGGFRTPFPISAVCGDFTQPNSPGGDTYAPPVAVRLFALTGLTLGNHRESSLLGRIRAAMGSDDYLLLDARMHRLGSRVRQRGVSAPVRAEMLRSYDLPSQRRFVFGPVETATLATAADVTFGYELSRRVTVVPSALNIIVYCTGLRTTMRLSGRNVRRDRLFLGATTIYHLPDLLRWLPSAGFAPLWYAPDDGIAVILLKRSAARRF